MPIHRMPATYLSDSVHRPCLQPTSLIQFLGFPQQTYQIQYTGSLDVYKCNVYKYNVYWSDSVC